MAASIGASTASGTLIGKGNEPAKAAIHQHVAGDRHQFTMGEIDQPHDRKHHRKSQCQERIGTAQGKGVDGLLQDQVHSQ